VKFTLCVLPISHKFSAFALTSSLLALVSLQTIKEGIAERRDLKRVCVVMIPEGKVKENRNER